MLLDFHSGPCSSLLFFLCGDGVFIALSKPVADLLFPGLELENLIIGFAAGIPFFYTESALIAVLRGMGNNVTPIITSIGSFFITNTILYILVAKTLSGIYGYAIALITASSIAVCISISKLEQMFCKKFNVMDIALKPMLCCVFMVYILNRTYSPLMALRLPNLLCIMASLLLGLGGYLLLALALGINLRNLTL